MKLNEPIMRERRRPGAGQVTCIVAPEERVAATWVNLSRRGASIRLDRGLRPGTMIILEFASPLEASLTHRLEAVVAWCRPVSDADGFEAGLRVRRDRPDAVLAFASLNVPKVNRNPASGVETKAWSHLRARKESTTTTAPAA